MLVTVKVPPKHRSCINRFFPNTTKRISFVASRKGSYNKVPKQLRAMVMKSLYTK